MAFIFKRDANGIPILAQDEVERLAERFLQKLMPEHLRRPAFLPLAEVMEKITHYGVTFLLDQDLGETKEGHRYLGWYDIARNQIAIDRSLVDVRDPRFSFTVAHELGHFYLHQKVHLRRVGIPEGKAIKDSSRDIVVHRISSDRPRTLMEWQANRFAAGILVPRATLQTAVEETQRDMGITRNRGTIWLDQQPSNHSDHRRIIQQLATRYQTSRAVLRIRLRELGIARDVYPGRGASSIGDVLEGALKELFT